MTGERWEQWDIDWVCRLYPHFRTDDLAAELGVPVSRIHNLAHRLGLHKHPGFYETEDAGRGNVRKGLGTRFSKGIVPWNKGKHWNAGGRSAETRFHKGHVPHTWVPVGTERDNGGYLERKVSDTGCTRRDFRLVHIMHWERYRGLVPEGHIVVFRNGDKRDIRMANLELISRAENMKRNTVWNRYPPEVAQAIHHLGQFKRRLKEHAEET